MRQLLSFLVIGGLLGVCLAQTDTALTPGARGHVVVEAALGKVESACIFKNDKLFFRRMAYVESSDGLSVRTYRTGYDGGIWQVDKTMYDYTKTNGVMLYLERNKIISGLRTELKIDWSTTKWSDLRKPLYSLVAARLYLEYRYREEIPADLSQQADKWKRYLRPTGDVSNFIRSAASLNTGCTSARGIDLAFVLDGSGSIGRSNFERMTQFARDVINSFEISPSKTRVSVVQYSSSSRLEFPFNRYTGKTDVLNALERIPYEHSGTPTHVALDLVREKVFQESNGARPKSDGHPRVAIVLTDGRSISSSQTVEAARKVHADDITVVSVGVGNDPNMIELEAIASAPKCMNVIQLSMANTESLKNSIQKKSCKGINVCEPDPCQNGAKCEASGSVYSCACADGFTGTNCENRVQPTKFNCADRNPCDPDKVPKHDYYFPHESPSKFVKCDMFGGCVVADCPGGLVWNDKINICDWPE